ncbi:uncharacterized protein METZ01_LOCUS220573, partial [marine metagenome]
SRYGWKWRIKHSGYYCNCQFNSVRI